MLAIDVVLEEGLNEQTSEIVPLRTFRLELEHSLASLSEWEAKYEKPFLSEEDKSNEEALDYILCMTLTKDVPLVVWSKMTEENYREINKYVNAKMTATWFNDREPQRRTNEIITSELIYYWMVALQIPWEAQYWHLNRLMTLIKVCNIKNQPEKKMSRRDAIARTREINARRRAESAGRR